MNCSRKGNLFDYIGRPRVAAEPYAVHPRCETLFSPPDSSAYCTDQVMPIAPVEIEVSPQSYEQQTKDGEHSHSVSRLSAPRKLIGDSIFVGLVIATCKELGIAIIVYS